MNTPTVDRIIIDADLVHDLIELLNGCDTDHVAMMDRLTAVAEAQGLSCWKNADGSPQWWTTRKL